MKIEPSKFDGWNTPNKILQATREVFGGMIDLDPCSNEYSVVDARCNLNKEVNGLYGFDWSTLGKTVFVNPPYDVDNLTRTQNKIIEQFLKGCEIIQLVPSKTDQYWFHTAIQNARGVCFIKRRVAFGRCGDFSSSGQFACTVFYYGVNESKFTKHFSALGECL